MHLRLDRLSDLSEHHIIYSLLTRDRFITLLGHLPRIVKASDDLTPLARTVDLFCNPEMSWAEGVAIVSIVHMNDGVAFMAFEDASGRACGLELAIPAERLASSILTPLRDPLPSVQDTVVRMARETERARPNYRRNASSVPAPMACATPFFPNFVKGKAGEPILISPGCRKARRT